MYLAVQVMTCGVLEEGKHMKEHENHADTVLISSWCLCIFTHKQGGYGYPPGGGGVWFLPSAINAHWNCVLVEECRLVCRLSMRSSEWR
eukprot:10828556-Karenia_brevis.AAC.1